MSKGIDVSTHQLAEEVADHFKGGNHKNSLAVGDILSIWYSIGR
jgi:hypothetical protein